MKVADIRQQFLDFFEGKKHRTVSSAPLVVKDDPTLMFTNAGMNQFKDFFLGNQKVTDKRIANSQKCLRVSGKHNDLEEVGVDTYHHTLFEMLGNWSFGDYFKKEAIEWAWELLTEIYKLPKEDLYVSVFEGDENDKVAKDEESLNLWLQYVSPSHIIMASKKDNFWEMGDTGPCGPCSEIHIDLRSLEEKNSISGRELVNKDHPQVIEIWNLVFMQFNRKSNGSLEPLPQTHVDTGMGLERLAMALQGKKSNYDIDIFQALIQKTVSLSGHNYGQNETIDIAHRVIADHIRAISFSIADGQLPSNNGAGYVIRRILRRAVRYGYQTLEIRDPFLFSIVSTLVDQMGAAYPELKSQQELIEKVIKEEEISFLRTLALGIKRIHLLMDQAKQKNSATLLGTEVFELYDTFGFPLDLTSLIARENNFQIDEIGFQTELEKQKNRSRAATGIETDDWQQLLADVPTEFVGYDVSESPIKILRYRKVIQNQKTFYQLVFNQTPFYAEGGGQVGDSGIIESNSQKTVIFDTKKENNLIVHFCKDLPSDLTTEFSAKVDLDKRKNTEKNHTATHLLHHALREVLGTHVEQKGSLVCPDYLRFDFSHYSKITDEQLDEISTLIEEKINSQTPLKESRNTPIEDAKSMGAMALFGEKYGNEVRVIQFDNSIELCGGTHVKNTSEIGMFRIQSESAVAAGIRRIEMITGKQAESFYKDEAREIHQIKALLRNPKDVIKSVQDLLESNQKLSKEVERFSKERSIRIKNELTHSIEVKDGISILCTSIELDANSVKDILFQLKGQYSSFVGIIGNIDSGSCGLTVIISDNLTKSHGFDASKWIREASVHIQGGGGGQAFFATAGGKNKNGIPDALALLKQKI